MLTLVLGRAGSGKSEYLYKKAAECAEKGITRQIFLVPETHSHLSERKLCEIGGDSISRYCEVLTFRRLMNRVFTDLGGLAQKVLDDGGRILYMHEAFINARDALKCYGGTPDTKILSSLVNVVDELKSCCVSDNALLSAAEDCDHPLDNKLRDIVAIRASYDHLTENGVHDPRDEMTRLADLLRGSTWFDGRKIYIDGFSGFTPQESAVLEAMSRADVTAAFTCNGIDDESEIFAKSTSSAKRLMRYFGEEAEIVNLDPPPRFKDLSYLEKSLFTYSSPQFEEDCPHIELRPSEGMMEECERAAARVLELMRGGMRCRDIAVVCGDYQSYSLALESAFDALDIPYYVTKQSDLAVKPVTALIMRALKIASQGFRHEDVMAYIKTGLAGLDIDESSLLENYCLVWRIRPGQWTQADDWHMNPRGFGMDFTESDREELAVINDLRARVKDPLVKLADGLRSNGAASKKIRALYDFITVISLPAAIEKRASELDELGRFSESDEYSQLWSILCACLDSFMSTCGDRIIDAHEFCDLFTLVLSGSDIGAIPPSVDRVTCGGLSRIRPSSIKAVLILGANDGMFPCVSEGDMLLTDYDRDVLSSFDIELAYTADSRASESLEDVYMAVSKPKELLYISWAEADSKGNKLRPSWLMQRMSALMPKAVVRDADDNWRYSSRRSIVDLSLSRRDPYALGIKTVLMSREDMKDDIAELERRAVRPSEHISTESVTGMYGEKLRFSYSSMDKFNECRFAYYAKFGLGLRALRPADFSNPETGTYIHYILENTVRDVQNAGGFKQVSLDRVKEFARAYALDYIKIKIPDFNTKTPRFKYLINRLQNSVDEIITNLYNEFSVSDFVPMDFELRFSDQMPPVDITAGHINAELRGTADRVDGWVKDGILYVRVVDYKTGTKDFEFGDLIIGRNLQMPVYLFALRRNMQKYLYRHPGLCAEDIVPAGLLYTKSKVPVISKENDIDDEELRKEIEKKLKQSGIVLEDDDVIKAMDTDFNGKSRFIPVSISKGEYTGTVTEEEFSLLEEHIDRVLRTTAELMYQGHIETNPILNLNKLSCEFCDYKQVCFFEENEQGAKIRHEKGFNKQQFFDKVKEDK